MHTSVNINTQWQHCTSSDRLVLCVACSVAQGDYKYECVCPSPRVRIDAVYVKQDVCFVVYPDMQDIQYAHCG